MALNQESLERLWQHIIARLGRKVDKEDGKGLSSCDFTAEEKEKLKDLETNTRADWNETDPTSASYIVNTPTEVENNIIAEWDGVITEDMAPVNGHLYKISNYNDTDPSKISGVTLYLSQQGEIFEPLDEESLIYTEQDGISALYYDGYFYVVSAPIAEFSEAGTYLMYAEQEGYVKALNGKINIVKEKNISKKIARLTDLPCGEIPGGIYWDGDTTNKESVQLENGTFLYKVSDEFYNIEDLLGKKVGAQVQGIYQEVSISSNDIQSINEDLLIIGNAIIIALKEAILEGVGTFSPGTYFAKTINENSFSYISYLETDSTTKILDEKYIPDTIARKSDIVQSDWNENEESSFSFIKNRPFYEIDHSISWDGNTDGLECVQLDNETSIYKVSDYIPTIEELIGQFVIMQTVVDGTILPKKEIMIGSNDIIKVPNSNVLIVEFGIFVIPEDNITFDSIQFSHKGVYFTKMVSSKTTYISNMGIINLKCIDEKYLPKSIKANWDTNDEADLSYINNRTHWTEQIIENIIPETTVTFGAATKPGYDTGTATGSATQIYPEYGEVFDVEWNGTNYHLEVGSYTKTGGSSGHGIGNTGMFGGSQKSYPFLIGFLTEAEAAAAGYTYMVWVNDGSTSATFSVSGITGEEVHQLDQKFIPDTIARVEDINTAINNITHPITSINGQTGDVVLTASDVGALPDTTNIPSIEGLASENYVETKIAGLVNSAPETLNTLNELATALGNDPNFATTIAAEIGTKANANDLTSHIDNKSNPHNVTAAQIGAATEEYVNNAISNIPAPDVSGQINTHNTDTAAHNDIREAIANLNTLVGDTSVSAQIESAINALREEILGGAW